MLLGNYDVIKKLIKNLSYYIVGDDVSALMRAYTRLVHNNRGCFAGAYGYLLRALEVEEDIQVSSEDLADIHFIFDHLCY